jgi:hypothetical protein
MDFNWQRDDDLETPSDELESLESAFPLPWGSATDPEMLESLASDAPTWDSSGVFDDYDDAVDFEVMLREALLENHPEATPEEIEDLLFHLLGSVEATEFDSFPDAPSQDEAVEATSPKLIRHDRMVGTTPHQPTLDRPSTSEVSKALSAEARGSLNDAIAAAGEHAALTPSQTRGLAQLLAQRSGDEDTLPRAAETLGLDEYQLLGVRRGLALSRVSGGDAAVTRVAARMQPSLSDECANLAFASLAAMTESDWASIIAAGKSVADAHLINLQARAAINRTAQLFPQDVLLAPTARRPSLEVLATVIDQADSRNSGAQDTAMSLAALAGAYPGLRLRDVVQGEGTSRAKAAEVERRLSVLATAYAANAELPVLQLDYMPGGDAGKLLDLSGVAASDRPLVLNTFKAMRRVQDVTGLASDTHRLMTAGYDSAASIAAADPVGLAAAADINMAAATTYIARAKTRGAEAALALFAAHDAAQPLSEVAPFAAASTPIGKLFTQIPGYAELFGSTAFCACRHCQSVLSPAAYFVDLMRFVQSQLTEKAFSGRPDNYPLRLKERRRDLWDDLPLTCESTEVLVPYLTIVNEVLEKHVASALGVTGPTIKQQQVYRRLATATGSVRQPFNLQLERITAYLGHFRRTRADTARILAADEITYGRAWLGLSVTGWDLVVRPRDADTGFLSTIFGPATQQALTTHDKIDVQAILAATGWSRSTLGELLATAFVRGTDKPEIQAEKRDPASVQNDIERITGLTTGVLDRMHRLWRLQTATGIAVSALDLLLRAIPAPAAGADETSRILGLVRLLEASQRLQVPLDATCALIGPIPEDPLYTGGTSLFDRLFNLEPFASQQGRWPEQMPASFEHPSFAAKGVSSPDNRTLQRLLAGLQVSDTELVQLLTMLGMASTVRPAANLTRDTLALLFRHALLARAFNLPTADLGRLLRLSRVGTVNVGTTATPTWINRVTALNDLRDLFANVDDWQALGISLDDAEYVINGRAAQPTHLRTADVAKSIAEQLDHERPWEFADTVLATLPEMSESDSRLILNENTARSAADAPALRPLEPASGSSMLRIRAAVNPSSGGWSLKLPAGYTPPPGVPADRVVRAVTDAVIEFDPLNSVAKALATGLAIAQPKLTQLLRMSGPATTPSQPLEASRAAVVSAIYAADTTAVENALLATRPSLLRLALLLNGPEWDAAAVQRIADDRELAQPLGVVFDIGIDLSWRAVVEAKLYQSLARDPLEQEASEEMPHPNREALTRALAITDWTTAANDGDLAAALATDRARIAALRPNLPLASIPRQMRRLERLREALRLATLLGVSGETLRTLVPTVPIAPGADLAAQNDAEYDALGQGADALYGVLRTLYPDASVFEQRLAPFEDLMRSRRRDALVDYLLHPGSAQLPVTFASASELYGYFLLDIEMGGCAKTSRIVAATQSVQLYVHRVLMSLEAGMWDSTAEEIREQAIYQVREQWEWRRQYRVWEANRRIFLFPESYLEPELRDDRTPLFEEVADELLQQETTETNVTAAYTRYLVGLDEIMGLRLAGLFHEFPLDFPSSGDLLHIVSATNSDPPQFYYRTARNLRAQFLGEHPARPVFSAWEKMNIQIPVRDVTPAMIRGRLHVFWLEIATRPITSAPSGGTSEFLGYDHKIAAKFTMLQPDGRWTGPQQLTLLNPSGEPWQVLRDRFKDTR